MKDMLSFMIARDTMHQQQWLAVIEEIGGYEGALPILNSFPQAQEKKEFSYAFISTGIDGATPPKGRYTSGPSLDGKGEYSLLKGKPYGEEPKLAPPMPAGFAETQQMTDGALGGLLHKVAATLTGHSS